MFFTLYASQATPRLTSHRHRDCACSPTFRKRFRTLSINGRIPTRRHQIPPRKMMIKPPLSTKPTTRADFRCPHPECLGKKKVFATKSSLQRHFTIRMTLFIAVGLTKVCCASSGHKRFASLGLVLASRNHRHFASRHFATVPRIAMRVSLKQ